MPKNICPLGTHSPSQKWPRIKRASQPSLSCLFLAISFLAGVSAQTTQTITITTVTNTADFQPGLPEKGGIASIFLTRLQGGPGVVTVNRYPLSNVLDSVVNLTKTSRRASVTAPPRPRTHSAEDLHHR
jgi:hypothetical protein